MDICILPPAAFESIRSPLLAHSLSFSHELLHYGQVHSILGTRINKSNDLKLKSHWTNIVLLLDTLAVYSSFNTSPSKSSVEYTPVWNCFLMLLSRKAPFSSFPKKQQILVLRKQIRQFLIIWYKWSKCIVQSQNLLLYETSSGKAIPDRPYVLDKAITKDFDLQKDKKFFSKHSPNLTFY